MENSKPSLNKRSQRRENRIATIQFLYQWELNKPEELNDAVATFLESLEKDRGHYAFAEELIHGTLQAIEVVDQEIVQLADNWEFKRIAKVDLSILRLAIYELLHRNDIPPIVSINEAIDLSKDFSTPDSKRFINGVLDRMKNKIDRPLRKAAD
ncbi:MAG: N utilization substance protein B [Opitutia bacterium UBA7350]|nr:MAG: N utilization substance protein B [Opitutae bacterium UBA7350]